MLLCSTSKRNINNISKTTMKQLSCSSGIYPIKHLQDKKNAQKNILQSQNNILLITWVNLKLHILELFRLLDRSSSLKEQ